MVTLLPSVRPLRGLRHARMHDGAGPIKRYLGCAFVPGLVEGGGASSASAQVIRCHIPPDRRRIGQGDPAPALADLRHAIAPDQCGSVRQAEDDIEAEPGAGAQLQKVVRPDVLNGAAPTGRALGAGAASGQEQYSEKSCEAGGFHDARSLDCLTCLPGFPGRHNTVEERGGLSLSLVGGEQDRICHVSFDRPSQYRTHQ